MSQSSTHFWSCSKNSHRMLGTGWHWSYERFSNYYSWFLIQVPLNLHSRLCNPKIPKKIVVQLPFLGLYVPFVGRCGVVQAFLVPTNGKHHTIVPHTQRGKPVQYDINPSNYVQCNHLFSKSLSVNIYISYNLLIRISIAKSTYLILFIYLSAACLQYVPICLGQWYILYLWSGCDFDKQSHKSWFSYCACPHLSSQLSKLCNALIKATHMSFPNLAPFKRMLSPGILLQKYMIVNQCPAIQGPCKNPPLAPQSSLASKFLNMLILCEIQFSIHQSTNLVVGAKL